MSALGQRAGHVAPVHAAPQVLRTYGIGAQILIDLGIESMILLTNTSGRRVVALEGYGLKIVETRPLTPGTVK